MHSKKKFNMNFLSKLILPSWKKIIDQDRFLQNPGKALISGTEITAITKRLMLEPSVIAVISAPTIRASVTCCQGSAPG